MPDGVTVIHGDCLEVMAGMESGSVDAVVTDPPYGIRDKSLRTADSRRTGNRRGKRVGYENDWHPPSEWDDAIDPRWCEEVCRIAPTVAWFGHWRHREDVAEYMLHPLRAEIVWAKDCHAGPPCPLAMRDERIWLFAAEGIKGRTFETSVWDEAIIPTWNHKRHKNEKPLSLMARLIRFLTDPDAMILDPFAGSGSTGVACIKTGRRCVLIEKDGHYVDVIHRRLESAATPLFSALTEP